MRVLERKVETGDKGPVSCLWNVPEGFDPETGTGLVLAHGAGKDMHSAFMTDMAEALARRGILVVRFNFPYAERAGRRPPDRAPVLEATWRAVLADVRADEQAPRRLFLGGRSMGGRMASHLAADGEACDGLVFLGYPLHPAGKPERLRAEHLDRIPCPMLFVQGSRDKLCELDRLRPLLAPLADRTQLHVIEGGDHGFNVLKRMGRSEAEVLEEIVESVAGWIQGGG